MNQFHASYDKHDYCFSRPVNEDRQKSEASAGEKEEDEEAHEDDQFKTRLEVESDEDAGSGSLKIMKGLLEREWSR